MFTQFPSLEVLLTLLGLSLITILSRTLFFISSKPWAVPKWLERGLQYAPIAALCAVIAPQIFIKQEHFITTWQDARIFAAIAAILFVYFRRQSGQPVLGAIIIGMLVFLPLHLILGW